MSLYIYQSGIKNILIFFDPLMRYYTIDKFLSTMKYILVTMKKIYNLQNLIKTNLCIFYLMGYLI